MMWLLSPNGKGPAGSLQTTDELKFSTVSLIHHLLLFDYQLMENINTAKALNVVQVPSKKSATHD